MAELVDALVSGTSVRKDVQVRLLFWAPHLDCLIALTLTCPGEQRDLGNFLIY